ncbi:MAG TPA: protein kinase, partial [Polyangiaceae bacterium]|nr:protein kinase [Polyangiaceae bacterium]
MFESTASASDPELPARYEAVRRLGQGGGGEVWAVRDRTSGGIFALKVLAEDASDREMAALVREAAALSGLEGLGVPRVQGFGRLPRTGRAYMLRELVEGTSLDAWIARGATLESALRALASASDQLTVLHRAGLLHGDVKPANVIVHADGSATFVDLGLAAPFREGGAQVEGLSPKYAAPELFEGRPLTARAEVYALGVTLQELLETHDRSISESARAELARVAEVATSESLNDRYPSADEFASALRRGIGLGPSSEDSSETAALWPVVGIDAISAHISKAADALGESGLLVLTGETGAGRTALLRRLSWSLGARGEPVVLFDRKASASEVDKELAQYAHLRGVFVLIDDADEFDEAALARLREARVAGARLVVVGKAELGVHDREIEVPPLDTHAARDLVRRAIPSLGDAVLTRVIELSGGRPGELRRIVRLIAKEPLASTTEVERLIGRSEAPPDLPSDPLERALLLLARGRYIDAAAALDELPADVGERAAAVAIARARLDLGLGDAEGAHQKLAPFVSDPQAMRDDLLLYWGRAKLGTCDYAGALEILGALAERESPLGAEAKAFYGLALSLVGRQEEAQSAVGSAVERARALGDARSEAVTLASQGLVEQRADRTDEARAAYEAAITAAERANDVGTLALVRANLAGLLKVRGDIAGAIEQFEAALDMGRRSGRRQTARQALLNLANLDVYLGRIARARARIEALEEQRAQLPQLMRAQITGLTAELLLKEGSVERAVKEYEATAREYEALGLAVDASEARLEAVLAGVRANEPDTHELRRAFELGRTGLGDTKAHRPLLLLAAAGIASAVGDEAEARARLDEALVAAREASQREWLWRALAARAELEETGGQPLLAKRDREEAVAVLEEIGARLPRDLREVYWNDARRNQLRTLVANTLASAATEFSAFSSGALPERAGNNTLSRTTNLSQLSTTPLERRLARLLEVNAELAAEHDLERLTARITDYAVELARAERGLVILRNPDGTLVIKSSRARGADQPDAEFSRSIAEEVMESHKPVVALNARSDARMKNYRSVHQFSVES